MRDGRAGAAGLEAGDSPGEKMTERQRGSEDSSDIHFIWQQLSLVWRVRGCFFLVWGGLGLSNYMRRPTSGQGHEYDRL